MAFLNTEFTFSSSGVSNLWLASNIAFNAIRNSGGIVNIAGPVIVKSIYVVPASGQGDAPSLSGVHIAVNHATSGMVFPLSGQGIFYFQSDAQSGLATGNLTPVPDGVFGIDFLARSGVATVNSGTHVFDLIVLTAAPQT